MSVQDISELFHHIVQSEEKIKLRFEELKKVNNSIKEYQEKIKSSKYECEVLRGKINTVNHKLIQEKIQKNWLQSCQDILKIQLENCLKEKEDLNMEIKEKTEDHKTKRFQFLVECDTFIDNYLDMCFGDNYEHATENWQQEFVSVQKDHEIILKDIDLYEMQIFKGNESINELDNVNKELEEETIHREQCINMLQSIEQDISSLQSQKKSLTKKVSTDPEFRNVLKELEKSKENCSYLSRKHQDLTKEMYDLQRQVLTKNERKRSVGNPWSVGPTTPKKDFQCKKYENKTSREFNKGKKIFRYNKAKIVPSGPSPSTNISDFEESVSSIDGNGKPPINHIRDNIPSLVDISLNPEDMFVSQDIDLLK